MVETWLNFIAKLNKHLYSSTCNIYICGISVADQNCEDDDLEEHELNVFGRFQV